MRATSLNHGRGREGGREGGRERGADVVMIDGMADNAKPGKAVNG
jgi:hypothetical protein